MRSKLFTTVIVGAIVGPFAYLATADAASIKQHLNQQHEQIQQLNVESEKLDAALDKTVEVKQQTAEEVQKIEKETQDAINERKKLEAELGAN